MQDAIYIYLIIGFFITVLILLPDQFKYIKKNSTPRWRKRDFAFAYITVTLVSLFTSIFWPLVIYEKVTRGKNNV